MGMVKAIYINLYFGAGALGAAHALWALYNGGLDLAWLGVLIACAPIPLYLAWVYVLIPGPRTHEHLPQLMAPAVLGTLLVISQLDSPHASVALLYSMGAGLINNLLYIYWYSVSAPPPVTLARGGQLPDFTLDDENGEPVTLSELNASYSLLMFFRGNWCPLCMAQVREVSRHYQALAERGTEVLLISPQSSAHTAALAKRFDVPMRFLQDPDNKMAKQFGILNKNGLPVGMDVLGYDRDNPHPTIILCDANRRIISLEVSLNYRVRPEPQQYIEKIDAYEKVGGAAAAG